MADCYHCGAWIDRGQGYRRNVHTGTSNRVSYGSRSSNYSTGNRFALRTLCKSCALQADEDAEKAKINGNIALAIVIVAIFLFLMFLRGSR